MSQAITVQGVYRNNKMVTVGAFNPKNNRFFNNEEVEHLINMMNELVVPKYDKFKHIKVSMHNEGKKISDGNYVVDDFKNNNTVDVVNTLIEYYKFNLERKC